MEYLVGIQTPAGECASLGYSDHGVFLAVHMVKHFIGTGLNLRMMLDLALFLSAHREEIDFGRFWNVLQKLQFAGIVNCVLHIMVESGGFSWEDFPGATKPELRKVDAFLADMLQRMYTGAGEDNAYYEYSKCVMRRNMKPLEYKGYMLSWTVRNTLAQMWPDKEQLFAMYRVEKPIAWMVPVLRLRRIIDLPLEKIRSGITPGRLLARGKDAPNLRNRMELFKFLDML